MNFFMHPFLPSLHFAEIAYIKRRSHAIGVGADALIQFAQPAHAACALEAIKQRYPQIDRKLRLDSHGFSIVFLKHSQAVNDMKVLGPQVIARHGFQRRNL